MDQWSGAYQGEETTVRRSCFYEIVVQHRATGSAVMTMMAGTARSSGIRRGQAADFFDERRDRIFGVGARD
jgi:hypothetical protein